MANIIFKRLKESSLQRQRADRKEKFIRREPEVRRLRIEALESRNLLAAASLSAIDSVATETGYTASGALETPDYAEVSLIRSAPNLSATISFRLEGAAVAGSDYTLWRKHVVGGNVYCDLISVSGQYYDQGTDSYYSVGYLPFDAGVGSVTLQFRPLNDILKELNEQATITLTNYSDGTGTQQLSGSSSITINDNDDWTVGISVGDSSSTEAPTGQEDCAVVTLTRSGETDVSQPLSVAFETYGDADSIEYDLWVETPSSSGVNFTYLSSSYSYRDEITQELRTRWSATIPSGYTDVDVQLRPRNDNLRELTEEVAFDVIPSSSEYGYGAYLASSNASVTVVIIDNDDWTVGVSTTDSSSTEAPTGQEDCAVVTLTRSGETDVSQPLSVAFETYGDADSIEYDLWVETPSSSGVNFTYLSSSYSYRDEITQELRTRWSATIPSGYTDVDVQLRPRNDNLRELTEEVSFDVVPSSSEYGYGAYLASDASVTVVINDNDDWLVSIVATDSEAAEAPSVALDPGFFTISRTGETDYTYPLSIHFKLMGTADYPYSEDFALTGPAAVNLLLTGEVDLATGEHYYMGTLTIPAGLSSVDLYVRPHNDQIREETETVVATLQLAPYLNPETNLPSYLLGATQATVTIEDNDQWVVAIIATNATAAEEDALGVHYGNYTITRSGETDVTYSLRVFLQTTGTTNSADYAVYQLSDGVPELLSLTPGNNTGTGERYYNWSVLIPAGATSASIEVRPIDDRDAERDETLVTSIRSYDALYLADTANSSATITIEEETTVTLTVVDSVALEPCAWITAADRRAQYRLTVETTETNWNNINVRFNVSGTATARNSGSTGDYYLTRDPNGAVSSLLVHVVDGSATFAIPGGQPLLDFYAMPNNDVDFEVDEDVILTLAQAFSRSTANQVDCVNDVEPVVILQAPEFVSGNDSNPPLVISNDSYVGYVNKEVTGSVLLELDQDIRTYINGNRQIQYEISEGNSSNYFAIDSDNGTVSLNEAFTEHIKESGETTYYFTIKVYDANNPLLYDLATVTINIYDFNYVRISNAHQSANQATRAVIRDVNDSYNPTYELNARSDYDRVHTGIVLGGWDSSMTIARVNVEIGASASIRNRILWVADANNECRLLSEPSGLLSGSFSDGNSITIDVLPSSEQRSTHEETNDLVVQVGFDSNNNGQLESSEVAVAFNNRIIGKNEYDHRLNKLNYSYIVGFIHPLAQEFLGIFLKKDQQTSYSLQTTTTLNYQTDSGAYSQANGIGANNPNLTSAIIDKYVWNSASNATVKIFSSDLFATTMYNAIMADATSYFEENPNAVSFNCRVSLNNQGLTFESGDLKYALHSCVLNYELSIDIYSFDTGNGRNYYFGNFSGEGILSDLYDFETIGADADSGSASRIQTCHRDGVRNEGEVFVVEIELDKNSQGNTQTLLTVDNLKKKFQSL